MAAGPLTDIDRLLGSERELRMWVSGVDSRDIRRTWAFACKYGLSRTVAAVEGMISRRMLGECEYSYSVDEYTDGLSCET